MRPADRLPPAVFLLAGFLSMCLPCCTVEQSWFPSGVVEIVDSYQLDDCPGCPIVIAYRIEHLDGGSPTILATTLSLRIETDERIYHRTVIDISRVRPGHAVYGTFEFLPDGVEEAFVAATVVDFFVE
jgi:hypothetical protein